MRHIPAAITQLCNMRYLNISHCNMLEEIPELPSSLREIDAHDCASLGNLSNPSTLLCSLLKWLKKVEPPSQGKLIDLGSHGIPGWVLHQEMGRQIRIEFPMNWYEDDQFLGFAFFFLHPLKSHLGLSFKFDEEEYAYKGVYSPFCVCNEINGNEDKLSLVYYPKTTIRDKFHSSQYMDLEVSFFGSNFGSQNKTKSCGVYFIYSQDHQQNHNSLDFPENSGDNKSTAKDIKRSHDDATHNQAEEPYHKRLRESNTHLKF
ncbi:disease resistance protein RPV1-like [Vitis riparia]|uniref:disease resistance protein RPV1-like n=1 Tax=Vitis riparia TaxID=96939 RepID=UPI00155B12B4|nr:disease resistance protein RPV1-like [Vitis riparia]